MDNNQDNKPTTPQYPPQAPQAPVTPVQTPPIVQQEVPNAEAPQAPTEEKKIDEGDNSTVGGQPEGVVEAPEEEVVVDEVIEQPTGPDASFNCPWCKGSGLIVSSVNPLGRICSDCHGTGKNQAGGAQYPEGTIVITKDSTSVVRDGNLVPAQTNQDKEGDN